MSFSLDTFRRVFLGAASFSSGAQRISACHPDGDSDDETVQLEEPTKFQHDAVEASKLMPPPPCLPPSKATVHSSRPRSPISQFVDPKSSVNSAGLLIPITPVTPLSNKPRVLYSEAIRTPQAIEREPPASAQGTRPLVPIPSIPSTPHALDPNSVIHVCSVFVFSNEGSLKKKKRKGEGRRRRIGSI